MEYSRSGSADCPKRGKRTPNDTECINGCGVKADFVLIQEHHLNKMRLTRFEEMLRNEWFGYGLGAYGENGIKGRVSILK